jgi:hypothetical protein
VPGLTATSCAIVLIFNAPKDVRTMDAAAKKQIMREAAVAPHLINNAYARIPTGQAFSSDIDRRVEHYLSSPAHTNPLLSASARGVTIHPAARSSSRAHHQNDITQLSDLLTYHTRHRWRDDVFSLADKSVSLQGIYRQSGKVMRCISRDVAHVTVRDCVAYQFARAVHWTAAQELERLIGGKSVQLPAPATGSDVGNLAINRCVMSAHGHSTDFNPLLPQVEPTAGRPERDRSTVVWLHDEEAAKHRVLIRGGLLYFATNGQVVDTASPLYRDHGAGPHGSGEFRDRQLNCAGYVLSLQGELFAGIHAPGSAAECMGKNPFYHSSYMAGRDVLCAGRIFVRQGMLVGIDNASGHYKPSADHLRRAIRELDRQGVDLEELYCEDVSRTNRLGDRGWEMLWPAAADFLAGTEGAPISGQWVQGNSAILQSTVAEYRNSRGMFSNTSTQTQDALNVLEAVVSNSMVFCVACVWYAFSPGSLDDDTRWLKNAKEFVEGKARVRLEPLEEGLAGRFSSQRFKSGLRSKLRAVLPERLTQIVGVYDF